MNIPVFANVRFVEQNGYLTPDMQLYNDELNQALQDGLSNNGWTLPIVTKAELAAIAALTGDNEMPNGTMWYLHNDADSTYEMIVKINGALRTVNTSAYVP